AGRLELRLDRGGAKAVGKVLLDHRLPGPWLDRVMDLGARGAGQEERRARPRGKMPHVEDWKLLFPRPLEDLPGLGRGRLGPLELHLAAGEVVVLEVDDDECFLSHASSSAPIGEW